MKSFVLVYERPTGKLSYEEFAPGHRPEAFARRAKLQRSVGPDAEVVVLHAEDLNDLRTTHRRYFERAGEMLRHMAV